MGVVEDLSIPAQSLLGLAWKLFGFIGLVVTEALVCRFVNCPIDYDCFSHPLTFVMTSLTFLHGFDSISSPDPFLIALLVGIPGTSHDFSSGTVDLLCHCMVCQIHLT